MIFTFSFFFLYCIQLPVSYESYEALFTEILFLTQIILQTDRQEQVCNSLPLPFLFIVPSLLNGDAPVHLHQVRYQSAHYPSDPCSAGYSILLIVLSFQPVLLLWQRVQPAQCGVFDTMQIAEKNREMISGITGNMHDGYDIIFKDGHSCHCRTKKAIDSSFFITKCVLHKTCNVLHKTAFPVLVTC